MYLAGIPLPEQDVFKLAGLLDDAGFADTVEALVDALEAEQKVVALTIQDREAMLRVLDDPQTDGLAELHGMLLVEHEWRVREGLV